jgi:hypothetical protein
MEKIIPGMPLESKAIITDFGWVVEMNSTQRYAFREKNKLGS